MATKPFLRSKIQLWWGVGKKNFLKIWKIFQKIGNIATEYSLLICIFSHFDKI
jgi:hypothetical protein